ncbi:MAG: hypothetical protein FJ386_11535, partial [Verrucomicrobia bacterium]|nr:hypothetical protein [Verrucomicrobiota bacterium]
MLLLASTVCAQSTNNFGFADFLLVPLRFHLLTATNAPDVHTTLTTNDIARILPKMNRIWAQAGVHFYIESLRLEPALNTEDFWAKLPTQERATLLGLRPTHSIATNAFNLYYTKKLRPNGIYFSAQGIFVKDTASLRPVEGGMDEPIPRVSSHELGHAFTLPHRQNVTNLMSSGNSSFWLNDEEIAKSRESLAKRDWVEPAPAMLKRADELLAAKKPAEARALYERLATLPLKGKEIEHAKSRAAATVAPANGLTRDTSAMTTAKPLAPQQALASLQIEAGLRVELAASEPRTASPVA